MCKNVKFDHARARFLLPLVRVFFCHYYSYPLPFVYLSLPLYTSIFPASFTVPLTHDKTQPNQLHIGPPPAPCLSSLVFNILPSCQHALSTLSPASHALAPLIFPPQVNEPLAPCDGHGREEDGLVAFFVPPSVIVGPSLFRPSFSSFLRTPALRPFYPTHPRSSPTTSQHSLLKPRPTSFPSHGHRNAEPQPCRGCPFGSHFVRSPPFRFSNTSSRWLGTHATTHPAGKTFATILRT